MQRSPTKSQRGFPWATNDLCHMASAFYFLKVEIKGLAAWPVLRTGWTTPVCRVPWKRSTCSPLVFEKTLWVGYLPPGPCTHPALRCSPLLFVGHAAGCGFTPLSGRCCGHQPRWCGWVRTPTGPSLRWGRWHSHCAGSRGSAWRSRSSPCPGRSRWWGSWRSWILPGAGKIFHRPGRCTGDSKHPGAARLILGSSRLWKHLNHLGLGHHGGRHQIGGDIHGSSKCPCCPCTLPLHPQTFGRNTETLPQILVMLAFGPL